MCVCYLYVYILVYVQVIQRGVVIYDHAASGGCEMGAKKR